MNEIDERVEALEETTRETAAAVQQVAASIAEMQGSLARMEKFVTGNGNPESGMILRLDRMEQRAKLTGWALGVCATAAAGSLAMAIVMLAMKLIAMANTGARP